MNYKNAAVYHNMQRKRAIAEWQSPSNVNDEQKGASF